MSEQRIPGIVEIGYLDASLLSPDLMLQSMAGIFIAVNVPVTWLRVVGESLLTWEGSMANGGRQEKATLKFNSYGAVPELPDLAFAVRTAAGREYLVGAREGRRPVVTFSETTGKRSGDPAVRSYTVTHVAQKSVLACVL